MQPTDPRDQQNPNINQFVWNAADLQPTYTPQPTGNTRTKKILIIGIGSLVILLIIAVIAALAAPSKNTGIPKGSDSYIAGPSTTLPQDTYNGKLLSLSYPKGLELSVGEELSGEYGQAVVLNAENTEIKVLVSGQAPEYADGEEGVSEAAPSDVDVVNIQTKDVLNSGQKSQKTTGNFQLNGIDYVVVYSHTLVGERHVVVTAVYPQANTLVKDSFDALLGSIKLSN